MADTPAFGTVLVTGGCGFVGLHLVAMLLKEPKCGKIHVISRSPNKNLHEGVEYHACGLVDTAATRAVVLKVRPRVIFHIASPIAHQRTNLYSLQKYIEDNVGGTQAILDASREASTPVFVYTSTNSVLAGHPHHNLDETAPNHTKQDRWCSGYHWSKTLAEKAVLQANSIPGPTRTVAIRISAVYGERDKQMVVPVLSRMQAGNTSSQIGDGTNVLDICSVENAVIGHFLAARALLDPSLANGPVAGEIFNITDGDPAIYWDYVRAYYRFAGAKVDKKDVKIIPVWVIVPIIVLMEWAYRVFTFGTRTPELTMLGVTYATESFTYNIGKAKRVLGYKPKLNREDHMRQAVRYELQRCGRPLPKED